MADLVQELRFLVRKSGYGVSEVNMPAESKISLSSIRLCFLWKLHIFSTTVWGRGKHCSATVQHRPTMIRTTQNVCIEQFHQLRITNGYTYAHKQLFSTIARHISFPRNVATDWCTISVPSSFCLEDIY
jgi:hypothetical protein